LRPIDGFAEDNSRVFSSLPMARRLDGFGGCVREA